MKRFLIINSEDEEKQTLSASVFGSLPEASRTATKRATDNWNAQPVYELRLVGRAEEPTVKTKFVRAK